MDKEDLKYVNAGILGCSESELTEGNILKEDYNFKSDYDNLVSIELQTLNKFLDKYGFEVEVVEDEDILCDIDWENSVGMFLNSIQDNASVFPIALNKNYILNNVEDKTDLVYAIRGTLWHEAGHGIFNFLSDVYELYDLDEEEVVEDFARYVEDSELYNILQQYINDDLEEQLKPKVKEDLSQEVNSKVGYRVTLEDYRGNNYGGMFTAINREILNDDEFYANDYDLWAEINYQVDTLQQNHSIPLLDRGTRYNFAFSKEFIDKYKSTFDKLNKFLNEIEYRLKIDEIDLSNKTIKYVDKDQVAYTLNEDWISDANKTETIKQELNQAYDDLMGNDKTRLYRYREWANNSNNDYKEYIYSDLLNGKKEDALHYWYNHYKLFTGNYDLSYDDFLNTPITLYRATNVNEKDDTTTPFFSYAQSKKLAQRFLDTTQRLHNNRTGEIEEIQIKPKDTLGMIPSDEYEIIVPNKAYQSRVDDMSSIVDNIIKYANENNVKLPYDRDYILTLFNKRDKENVKKLEAHLMNYIDKRKGSKIKESVDKKTFTFPNLKQAIDFFWKDRDAKIETIPIKKLVDDNDLLDDEDLQSYHQRQWDNKKASEFSIDKSKAKMWRVSEVPYAVRKKDGKLELGDGRHRTRALYNDGYKYVTLPVINETLDLSSKISTTINSLNKHDKLNTSKRINENTANIPTKKGKAYKVFKVKNGKLYPPMVANSGGKDTPIGVWLDAEEGEFAGLSKTGRPQVKRANKSGVLAYRPGWHLGDIPRARQFDRLNKETGEYEFPKDFVWAECEYAMDIDYQPEADEQGYMRTKVDDDGNVITYKSDKYQHSLAGLKKLPTKGYYKYRTNPDPNTVPWVITGQMKVNKLLDDFEVNEILEQNGVEPIHRQGGDKTLKELGLNESKVTESKTTPKIRESLLQEGKQDKENFKKWAEQAVEIAYKDRGLSDWERKGNSEYIVNWFENNRKNLKSPQNDYYYWIKEKNVQGAYDELNRLAVEQEKKKNSEKKSKEGAKLIYSDNDWKVYEITTYEASVKYGANTKWCISGSKRWSNGANGRGYWDDYTSKGVKFYFFIGRDTKYAIAIYPNGTDFEIFDAQDNSIAYIPNAPIIDEIKVDYYSHNEDRLMLNLIKTGKLPHICVLLSVYLREHNWGTDVYDKSNFDNFLQEIRDNVNEDYVKWLAVYNGLKDEEWYEKETGYEYEDKWYGDTTNYMFTYFIDNYASLDDALTKDNPDFHYNESEYFISDLYEGDVSWCRDWVAVWLHIARYIEDEDYLVNFIKKEIMYDWGYSDFEKVGLSKEYLQDVEDEKDDDLDEPFISDIELEEEGYTKEHPQDVGYLGESLDDFDDEVGKVYHGGIEKSLHKDFRSILWFTEDYDYALDFGENIFICNLNLKNTFIVGNTDGYVRGLIPTQFSTDFIRLANNLKVTPKELLKCNPEAKNIYSIVRTKAFKELCIKNGYDSVETEEFGHVCFGVFNLDQVDIVDTDFEDEITLETLSPMDESLKPNLREELLLEKGTDYRKQAIKIIVDNGLFNEDTATKIIDGLFRQDIHAFNHAPAWLEKYLKGIARMLVEYCDGDSSKAQKFLLDNVSVFEYYLNWVKVNREKVGNQLDDEFINKLSIEELNDKVNKMQGEQDKKSQDELSKMKFDSKSNYTLVPINSFEEFNSKYGGRVTGDGSSNKYAGRGGTAWCHANSSDTYDIWSNGGYMFFVLQRNDWKDIPFNKKTNKEMNGKDDYGTSLIAILVNKYGKLTNATLRCNHVGVVGSADNQYNSYSELSKIAGFNVEEEILKYDFDKFSTDTLFTVRGGVLIRTSEDINLYKDITEYTIPDSTIRIGSDAFHNCSNLTSITIPSSVTSIGKAAFLGCSSLTSITIPKSVTKIGGSAFAFCSKLTSIVIPPSVTLLDNGIFDGCTSLTNITIPNRVKSISYEAFYKCSSLTSIEIPSSVKSIGYDVFYGCSSLTSITIPNSVTSIGYDTFYNCSPNLTVFTDNDYVKRYCNEYEINCSPLSPMDESLKPNLREELLLEKGTDYKKQAVKIISNSGLFDEDTATKIIDGLFRQDIHAFNHAPAWLEKYLKGIARMLVEYCDGDKSKAQQFLTECPSEFEYYLTWVKQNREKIGNSLDDEFVNNLTYEQVKEKNNKIRDEIDAKSKDELSKMKFSNSSNYTLVPIDSYDQMHKLYGGHWTGDGTDEKGEYAGNDGTSWCHTNSKNTYNNWTNGGHRFFVLQRNDWKDIPFNKKTNKEMNGKDDYGNSLIAILVNRFGKLTNATLRCNHVGISGSADNQYNSYAELSKIAGFNVEEEVLKDDFEEFSVNKLFTVENGVLIRTIEDRNLYKDITEYTVPNGIIEIGPYAFESCENLRSITIPQSVEIIEEYAFYYCKNLRSITFEEGSKLTSIRERAFYNCISLTSITIPAGVEIIGYAAFGYCSNLTSIKIPSSVTSIGRYTFCSCSNLRSIEVSAGVEIIGEYVFYNCSSLTSIEIPDSVESIGDSAFAGCSSLTSLTIPPSVESLGYNAFESCENLRSITIPSSVTSIRDSAFYNCTNLTSITFEEGSKLTSIGSYAFYNCNSLTSIKIPASVTSIGSNVFDYCTNLTVFTDNDYVKRYCNKNEINCASLSEYHKS